MKAPGVTAEPVKLRIIRAASELFRKQGVHQTSPDEIIEASEAGKGQFYHHFKNKEGLIHAVLRYHLEAIESRTFPVDCDLDSWEALQSWFNAQIELQKMFWMARACPIGTIGNSLTEHDELIRQDVARIFDVMTHKLGNFFRNERAAGRLAKEADEEALATLCVAAMQGAMLLCKVARTTRAAEQVASEALAYVRSYRVGS